MVEGHLFIIAEKIILMNHLLKKILILLIAFPVGISAQLNIPNRNLPGEDGKDTSITIPNEFYNTLDNLLHSWIVQRAEKSNCRSSDVPVNISDSIYKLRLSKMPCLMEMPFNNTVRTFIELYTVRKRQQMEYMLGMSD